MRKLVIGVIATVALLAIPVSTFSQSVEIGPGGVRVEDGRTRRGGGQCEQLRLALLWQILFTLLLFADLFSAVRASLWSWSND